MEGITDGAVRLFIQFQWLDPKQTSKLHPEEVLTKERLAVLLTKMAKYNKLAAQ